MVRIGLGLGPTGVRSRRLTALWVSIDADGPQQVCRKLTGSCKSLEVGNVTGSNSFMSHSCEGRPGAARGAGPRRRALGASAGIPGEPPGGLAGISPAAISRLGEHGDLKAWRARGAVIQLLSAA